MKDSLKRDGAILSSDHPINPSPFEAAPLVQAVRRRRKGYEIEDGTLVEMAGILDALSRKYRNQIERSIEDQRLLKSAMIVADLHRSYLEQEATVAGHHIGQLFALQRQASRELRVVRKYISKLYPGWSRVFDEATRRAAQDNSPQK